MTAPDVRTAAHRVMVKREEIATTIIENGEPVTHLLTDFGRGFVDGAVWGAARVAPTREQVAEIVGKELADWLTNDSPTDLRTREEWVADAVLALMASLLE